MADFMTHKCIARSSNTPQGQEPLEETCFVELQCATTQERHKGGRDRKPNKYLPIKSKGRLQEG